MSLIHTTELCDAEPSDYLVALQCHTASVLLDPAAADDTAAEPAKD